jgi:hypothetical protein
VTIPKGSPVLWESGKVAGELTQDVQAAGGGMVTKGKSTCGPLPLPGTKKTMTLCFPKDAVPATKQ